jgi:iron(III) transport system substrate-binding protein
MTDRNWSRRRILKGTGVLGTSTLLGGPALATQVLAAAPPADPVTPALIEAARKEGKVVFYISLELRTAEQVAKAFEAKYPGIRVGVESTGSERLFQRVGQEYASNIHAVDVINTSDAAHFIAWKRDGILAPYVPEHVAKFYPAEHRDPEGMFATFRTTLVIIAYNTNLVKAEEAPKSFADLLDPKWAGKIVKAHPGFSGNTMTATYQMQRDLGWGWFEKLAKQGVLQVPGTADASKKLSLGERAVAADTAEYLIFQLKDAGHPVEPVYATEGSPFILSPIAIFKASPNPNAARLFQSFCLDQEAQQLMIEVAGLRSMHPHTREKAERKPLKNIKTMKDDAAAVEREGEEIRAHYGRIFKV